MRWEGVAVVLALAAGSSLGACRDSRAAAATTTQVAAPAGQEAAAQADVAALVEDPAAVYRVPVGDSPVRGPSDARVTIVEFGDLECPHCRQAAHSLKRLEEEYRGRIRVVWKHRPVSSHAQAVPAAMVVETGRGRGADLAWKLLDAYLAADPLDAAAIARIAREAGIDAEKARADQPARLAVIDRIRADQNLAFSLGVRSTPTFFVNGRKLTGAVPYDRLRAAVEAELARTDGLLASGVDPEELYDRSTANGATAPVFVPASAVATVVTVSLRPDDPARAGSTTRVTVVEFADFQCPFCGRALAEIDSLQREHPDVRVVWKHLPLEFHASALPAALAAEAARAQGKFWEMNARLFASQAALSEATYVDSARAIGLDLTRFDADRRAESTRRRVDEDIVQARTLGVTGTPTFVVDGEVLVGSRGLRDAVERHLRAASVASR